MIEPSLTDRDDTLRAGLTRTTSLEERETQAKQNLRCYTRSQAKKTHKY
jgi:hypothetical protein